MCLLSHGVRFSEPIARTEEIVDHHEVRLRPMTRLLDQGPVTPWELTSSLEWRHPWADTRTHARHVEPSGAATHLSLPKERGLASRNGSAKLPRWVNVAGRHRPD